MKMQTKVNRDGPRLRVALVEADGGWQDRLSSFFTARPDCVWLGAGATPRQLAKRLAGVVPDVLVAGFAEREAGACDRVLELRRDWPSAALVVLAAAPQWPHVVEALVAGARGYLLKACAEADLAAALAVAARQGAFVGAAAVPVLVQVAQLPCVAALKCPVLTPQERRVSPYLALGYCDKEIAEHLSVGVRTVQTHVGAILAKLGVGSRAEVAPALLGRAGVGRPRRSSVGNGE